MHWIYEYISIENIKRISLGMLYAYVTYMHVIDVTVGSFLMEVKCSTAHAERILGMRCFIYNRGIHMTVVAARLIF